MGTWLFKVYLFKHYQTLNQDIDHITSDDYTFNYEEIKDANQLIQDSHYEQMKQKQVFEENIRSLAHDIKTPISTALIMIEGIKSNRMSKDETIVDIEHELKQAANMIPQFIEIDFKKVAYVQDISLFIKDFIQRYQSIFETKQIVVESHLEPLLIKIADIDIKRLIEHLVFNAYYYALPNASIQIDVNHDSRTLIVSDTGIGMSMDTVQKVLTQSYRLEKTKTFNKNGTGQGYPIVLEIIRRLNANITIESELGKGTSIKVTF
jgi:signal transduction histidine kinase